MGDGLGYARTATLWGSVLTSLSAGTNYVFSAYAPQLASRLHITHTQLNIIGLSGNMGVSTTGPLFGRLVDKLGPRPLLISAALLLFTGYTGLRLYYNAGESSEGSISLLTLVIMSIFSFMTGAGGTAGLQASANSTAKSFSEHKRATTMGLVFAGFGLSAFFFSTLSNWIFPGNTSSLLLLLSLGTTFLVIIGLLTIRAVPLESGSTLREPNSVVQTDIHGKDMFLGWDFWLLFMILALLGGTGLTYINNVGSISQALSAKGNPDFDRLKAGKMQASQVSIISLANCASRIMIGAGADLLKNRFSMHRSYLLSLISILFIISQVVGSRIDNVDNLWQASVLLGLGYGGIFGLLPTITIEWFGMAHFSENWGFVALAAILGGNVLSLLFGSYLDAHVPSPNNPNPSPMSHPGSALSLRMQLVGAEEERQCLKGRLCYAGAMNTTIFGCILALGFSFVAAWRDRRHSRLEHKYVIVT